MTQIACNFTMREELLPYLSLPQPALGALVAKCQVVCLLTFGTGNPDLAGVGVVVSYALELVLAMLFGPLVLFEFFLVRAFFPGYTPTRFSKWLRAHQHTSLWSHLFFSFTVSLACCVHQYQASCAFYETAVITQVIGVTTISLLLVLAAVYWRIERMAIILSMFLATLALSAVALLAPASTLKKFSGLLQACSDQRLSWNKDAMGKYNEKNVFPETLSDIALAIALSAIWYYLWLRRRNWTEAEAVVTTPIRIENEVKVATPTKWVDRLLVSLAFLICIPLLKVAWLCYYAILTRRNALKDAWGGRVGEDVWGIGQIVAALAWTPLLVEMGYSAFQLVLKQRWQDEPATSARTSIAMNDLEAGQLQATDGNSGNLKSVASGSNGVQLPYQPLPALQLQNSPPSSFHNTATLQHPALASTSRRCSV